MSNRHYPATNFEHNSQMAAKYKLPCVAAHIRGNPRGFRIVRLQHNI